MAEFIPVDLFDIVIFGGTGDLSQRKLIPALWHRYQDDQIPEGSRIIGAARSEMDRDEFIAFAYDACKGSGEDEVPDPTAWKAFASMLEYIAIDATSADSETPD